MTEKIFNCHVHVFTGNHVPPYLTKKIVIRPFYYLIHLGFFIRLFRYFYIDRISIKFRFRNKYPKIYKFFSKINNRKFRKIIWVILSVYILLNVCYIVCYLRNCEIFFSKDGIACFINNLFILPKAYFWQLFLVFLFLVTIKPGRSFILSLLKMFLPVINNVTGPNLKAIYERYMLMGRFAFYKNQRMVFVRLKSQYPPNMNFVVYPMDMQYMEAGKINSKYSYHKQIEELNEIKERNKNVIPFLFADPRRMREEGLEHFNYRIEEGKILLGECFIKKYIEGNGFNGFKIYPPLGYYPFDETLLPLWKYAADNQIPITAHCSKGPIFYRGNPLKEWDYHPIFEEISFNEALVPLRLRGVKNKDFTANFTHPMNYLCLLEEKLLRKVVAKAEDNSIRELFGYKNEKTKLVNDLSHLKVNLAHFGSVEEWERFLESDRDYLSNQLYRNPEKGILFFTNNEGVIKKGKVKQIWHRVDWYSIICSLMLQYENVYADISHMLHNNNIQAQLKMTMKNKVLRKKVLFGTDFYVVRNYKSEKQLFADTMFNMTDEDFQQIAVENPKKFLSNTFRKY